MDELTQHAARHLPALHQGVMLGQRWFNVLRHKEAVFRYGSSIGRLFMPRYQDLGATGGNRMPVIARKGGGDRCPAAVKSSRDCEECLSPE